MLVFDDITFDRVASYQLAAQELACSLTSVVFAGDDTPYYAVGTAIVKPEEYEPQKGRLLLLAYRCGEDGPGPGGVQQRGDAWVGPCLLLGRFPGRNGACHHRHYHRGGGRLEVVEAKEVKGAVYAMQPFQGRLLATVNSKVHVFKWVPAGGSGGGGGVGGGAAELVSETSTPVQVLSLFLAAR